MNKTKMASITMTLRNELSRDCVVRVQHVWCKGNMRANWMGTFSLNLGHDLEIFPRPLKGVQCLLSDYALEAFKLRIVKPWFSFSFWGFGPLVLVKKKLLGFNFNQFDINSLLNKVNQN